MRPRPEGQPSDTPPVRVPRLGKQVTMERAFTARRPFYPPGRTLCQRFRQTGWESTAIRSDISHVRAPQRSFGRRGGSSPVVARHVEELSQMRGSEAVRGHCCRHLLFPGDRVHLDQNSFRCRLGQHISRFLNRFDRSKTFTAVASDRHRTVLRRSLAKLSNCSSLPTTNSILPRRPIGSPTCTQTECAFAMTHVTAPRFQTRFA